VEVLVERSFDLVKNEVHVLLLIQRPQRSIEVLIVGSSRGRFHHGGEVVFDLGDVGGAAAVPDLKEARLELPDHVMHELVPDG
jgi:hypothetical protein